MSGRDPRVDPKVGDVLRTARITRLVQSRQITSRDPSHGVLRVAKAPYNPNHGDYMRFTDWVRWAKKAEVIHAAE